MRTKILTNDGEVIYRLSQWLGVYYGAQITKRHVLYPHAMDDRGNPIGSVSFAPENGMFVDYFQWRGRKYSLDQFRQLTYPIFYEDDDGKVGFLSCYEEDNWTNPILLEFDETCEYVRVYEEERR